MSISFAYFDFKAKDSRKRVCLQEESLWEGTPGKFCGSILRLDKPISSI
ncbi:hypothetical protein SBF1_110012 [Candidatus Desulfosporosinus infrequens]|uniref:Uncharacterized protein n=1 Tax=Candidatus Desulfosporosinus infrequens TaxID=2043169 RepID=A0A2U3JWR7_9FIRM|nr:hypothetical protein SBF1_110012 [Candidatus Desulfosporosinus infrequens]